MKISQRISELLSGHDFLVKFSKGHNSVKNVDRVTNLLVCIFCVMEVSQRISEFLSGQDFHSEIFKGA